LLYTADPNKLTNINDLSDAKKEECLKKNIHEICRFVLPSMPVIEDVARNVLNRKNYSYSYEPVNLSDNDFARILENEQKSIFNVNDAQKISVPNGNMLEMIKFYFYYDLKSYAYKTDCYKVYKEQITTPGLHLSESNNDDWRKFPIIEGSEK